MNQLNNEPIKEVFILRNSNQADAKNDFQVLKEFMMGQQHYALLRTENDHPDDCYLYRVCENQLEEIEDEMEWERVSEAIDEYLFLHD